MKEYREKAPFPFLYLRQPNSGPARARNIAVQALNSTTCLFLGDDIFASKDLVRIHAEHHQQSPDVDAVGVGLTRWSTSGQIVTPFMKWLDESGVQFAYDDLLAGVPPSWKHFYTSNLSLKVEHLLRYPFDERFRKAAMEDIELGYRLAKLGQLSMTFLPDAVAEHFHPTNFRQACRRMVGIGESMYLLGELWPEHVPRTSWSKLAVRRLLQQRWLLTKLTDMANWWTEHNVHNPLMARVLSLHTTLAYEEAKKQANTRHDSNL
jgi:hypothetical protein